MKKLISNFTTQLSNAIQIVEKAELPIPKKNIRNVVICGMGGSGIGASIASEIAALTSPVPINIVKDYFLPHFVSADTLVIISSYSGNTEEALSLLDQAIKCRAIVVCITSGGKIQTITENHDLNFILIPGGIPPRAALGYSLIQLIYILKFYGIVPVSIQKEIAAAIHLLDEEENSIMQNARETAMQLEAKITVIYGIAGMEGVALRFRQQLNENAKSLSWHNVFPEMNHNEIQGWSEEKEQLAVVLFRNENDYIRTAKRIDITIDILENYNVPIIQVYSKGNSAIERMLYLTHWGDWVSYFIAEFKGIDTMDIGVIRHLKRELSKI